MVQGLAGVERVDVIEPHPVTLKRHVGATFLPVPLSHDLDQARVMRAAYSGQQLASTHVSALDGWTSEERGCEIHK